MCGAHKAQQIPKHNGLGEDFILTSIDKNHVSLTHVCVMTLAPSGSEHSVGVHRVSVLITTAEQGSRSFLDWRSR